MWLVLRAVRTYSLITSNNNTLFRKARKQHKTMKDEKIEMQVSKHTNLFQIVKQKEGYKIVTGNYIASAETFKTITQAEIYIGSKPWELIYNTIAIFRSYEKEMEKMAKQDSQNNEKN